MTGERIRRLRQAALAEPRVQSALGSRFAYIETSAVEPEKNAASASPQRSRVTFFSYDKSAAVVAEMTDLSVERVAVRPESSPREGGQEVEAAIMLARNDSRIREKVENLVGDAILSSSARSSAVRSHRVLLVFFSREEDDHVLFLAAVDLTDQMVLTAGPVAPNQ